VIKKPDSIISWTNKKEIWHFIEGRVLFITSLYLLFDTCLYYIMQFSLSPLQLIMSVYREYLYVSVWYYKIYQARLSLINFITSYICLVFYLSCFQFDMSFFLYLNFKWNKNLSRLSSSLRKQLYAKGHIDTKLFECFLVKCKRDLMFKCQFD
jgi:hypothetical protein